MNKRLMPAAIALIAASCGQASEPARAVTATPSTALASNRAAQASVVTPDSSNRRIALPSGDTLEVADGVAIVRGPDGTKLAENARVIRGRDSVGTCVNDGFRRAVVAGDGFVLRNLLCSGWFIIDEVMTFARSGDGYVLARFSAEYLDRRTAELDGPPRILTESELGHRRFRDLDPDELYPLLD